MLAPGSQAAASNGNGHKPPAARKRSSKYDWQQAFIERAHVGLAANAVAMHLFYFASPNGTGIFPSGKLLAERIGRPGKPADPKTIRNAIRELLGDSDGSGWLEKVREPNRGAHQAAEYKLTIPSRS